MWHWLKDLIDLRERVAVWMNQEMPVAWLEPGQSGYIEANQIRAYRGQFFISRNVGLRDRYFGGDVKITLIPERSAGAGHLEISFPDPETKKKVIPAISPKGLEFLFQEYLEETKRIAP
jgi:hypothetical protein